ncbi:Peptidoglycan-binding (PGRP) domain of peptidoglycan hydrolases-containing protein [Streptomyces sp. WMMB 714]|uniref:peptidoglycan-binding domain-containing protein n=1 Tax=Streptomyces sp. WMMB 714 TaxID=1286822 RepID=UPI0005F8888B|nr:peptidoglycan-binding protein [Streptomyces sp. WMMB 714]SCK52878.1 Peptidoglycan-binding (PGRP) domain of peptidoglycan hydrolases-containing protein [Streptomyces sp. WMMB 714]
MPALDEIPMLRRPDAQAAGAPAASRPRRPGRMRAPAGFAMPRRRFVQAVTAVGFAALGVFSVTREAYADGYDIWTGDCPSYASDHDCSPGCGPSTVFAESCEESGEHAGFHKNDGVTWTLRPNQCYSGTYDGWLWRFTGACGACGCGTERRCHDGYRSTESGWVKSICRYTTDCGCPGSVTWPKVASGAKGPDVYAVQHLVTHGGFTTEADGIFGTDTEAQVKAFQLAAGLGGSGTVDAATWPELAVTVRSGDSNHAVRGAQRQLKKHGYDVAVDGVFGPATEDGVTKFQTRHEIGADGIVGPETWRTMTGSA